MQGEVGLKEGGNRSRGNFLGVLRRPPKPRKYFAEFVRMVPILNRNQGKELRGQEGKTTRPSLEKNRGKEREREGKSERKRENQGRKGKEGFKESETQPTRYTY